MKKTSKKKPEIWDEPVAPNLVKELALQAKKGRAFLFPKKPPKNPQAIAAAILAHVDAVHAGKAKRKKSGDHALMLACTWGEAVAEELGYEWVNVKWKDGGAIGLVPKNRAFAIYPLPYIQRIYDDRDSDNTILLLFNMLVAGNVPRSKARAYTSFG